MKSCCKQQFYTKVNKNTFKLNIKDILLPLEVKQYIKSHQMQKKLQFVNIWIN